MIYFDIVFSRFSKIFVIKKNVESIFMAFFDCTKKKILVYEAKLTKEKFTRATNDKNSYILMRIGNVNEKFF